ncbi:MAG: response regulator [Gemmatimonas sp.]|nr:response regulator [Gemmatimonas sp.]
MKIDDRTVLLVEDDASVRQALSRLISGLGYGVETCSSAEELLDSEALGTAHCVILDLQLPGVGGLELQETLLDRGTPLPIVFLSGYADIPTSVRAMKLGAVDFLEKPVDEEALFEALGRAIERSSATRAEVQITAELERRYSRLTPREREVYDGIVAGRLNKQVAMELGIAEKTVKVHRSRVMKKMGARSLAQLVQMALGLGTSGNLA